MKDPIISRRAFFDSNTRYLDFHLVQTPLGQMVEPRPLLSLDAALNPRLAQFPIDYASRQPLDTDSMFLLYGTGGQQIPTDWDPRTEPGGVY